MADHYTPRLALPYPDLDDPADVPADMQQLADRLDAIIPGAALANLPVLDVGVVGQTRAGRQLTAVDFTALGLSAPVALWNLSDLTDVSGNGRALTNKGAVTFAPGINGAANTAAQFTGSAVQSLYITDTGAADALRIKVGSWGCWFRTAKRGTRQFVMAKGGNSVADLAYVIEIATTNTVTVNTGNGTTTTPGGSPVDVVDDRWHFIVGTFDGAVVRTYIDGLLDGATPTAFATLNPSAAVFNIGSYNADAGTAAGLPFFGRIDEAFVTADVLSEDQVRMLYAAKLAHGFSVTPRAVRMLVHRRRRGGAFVPADFSTPPLRLHNFTQPNGLVDEGSNGQNLAGGALETSGADGARGGGALFVGTGDMSATDAGLPAALTARSLGCWIRITSYSAVGGVLGWGTVGTGDVRLVVINGGGNNPTVSLTNGGDGIPGPSAADGHWHFYVGVEDNAAVDGVKRKLYLDGRLVNGSTVMNAITLAGAARFRIGANPDGSSRVSASIDGAFVCGYALTAADVAKLYAKGSQELGASPRDATEHVEAIDDANVYLIGDPLDSQHTYDLGVVA